MSFYLTDTLYNNTEWTLKVTTDPKIVVAHNITTAEGVVSEHSNNCVGAIVFKGIQ